MDGLVEKAREVKCPFWRRRFGDAAESLLAVAQFVAARHKSLELPMRLPSIVGGTAAASHDDSSSKARGLAVDAVMEVVRADFEQGQYYVTGALNPSVYDDACFFDGPDPDMPVRSLSRYCDALSGLFDPALSSIELVSMEPVSERAFVAHWRLSGALKLPWRPTIKPYAGATRYELNADGLIASHTESWSVSVLDAFGATVWPAFGSPPAPSVDHHVFVDPPLPRLTDDTQVDGA